MLAATVFLLIAPLAGFYHAARADTLGADDLQRVSDGEAVVRVDPAESPADGLVTGAVDIDAPPAAVWDVLVSCDRAAEIMPNLTACRVLEAAPDGRSDVREHRIRWLSLLPEIRSEFRSVYDVGRSIRFARSGGDMRALDGQWRIEPVAKGTATRLHYVARVGFGALVPGFIIRKGLAKDVPGFLNAIRTQAMLGPRSNSAAR